VCRYDISRRGENRKPERENKAHQNLSQKRDTQQQQQQQQQHTFVKIQRQQQQQLYHHRTSTHPLSNRLWILQAI
jgi:hypothetical protein